jgi:hypothetical protein
MTNRDTIGGDLGQAIVDEHLKTSKCGVCGKPTGRKQFLVGKPGHEGILMFACKSCRDKLKEKKHA